MAQSSLKTKDPEIASAPQHKSAAVESLSAQLYALAREARQPNATAHENAHILHDFSRITTLSGRAILINDIIAMFAAFTLGGIATCFANLYFFAERNTPISEIISLEQLGIFLILGASALLWFDTKGHYRQRLPYWEMIGHILTASFVGFIISGFVHFASKDFSSRLWIGLTCVLFAVFIFSGRIFTRRILNKHGKWQIPAIMIGNGPTAQNALHVMNRESEMGFKIVSQIDPLSLSELEKPYSWKNLLVDKQACHVFLALEGSELEGNPTAIKSLAHGGIPCSIIPPWLGLPTSTLSPHHFMMQDVMMLHHTSRLQLPLPRLLKRSFDILASSLALIALSPLFIFVSLKVRSDGGPAFFKQSRIGKNGKAFGCYKFRSMRIDAEEALHKHLAENAEAAKEWAQSHKLKNDVRITSFGHFIRRTSVDELPQLINVLKGEMSLVGPRPIVLAEVDRYDSDIAHYYRVSPGITGLWQVSGRSDISYPARVQMDSWYVLNWSLWCDVAIICKTLPALLKRTGAY